MRLPRLRFTLRGAMIAMAATTLIGGGGASRHRRETRYRAEVDRFARYEAGYLALAVKFDAMAAAADRRIAERRDLVAREKARGGYTGGMERSIGSDLEHRASLVVDAAESRTRAARMRLLRGKYERAILYFWFPVEPDPPELKRHR